MLEVDVVGLPWERVRKFLAERQIRYTLTFTEPPRGTVPSGRVYIVRQRCDDTGCYQLVAVTAPAVGNGVDSGIAPPT